MFKSTFAPETIFRRSIRLKWRDRTCWTIQTHSDKLTWVRRKTFLELNSLSLVRFLKSSMFGLALRATTMTTAKLKLKPFKTTTLHAHDSFVHFVPTPELIFSSAMFYGKYELTTSNFPSFFCMWMWFYLSLNFIRLHRVIITPSAVERRKRLEAIGWISG